MICFAFETLKGEGEEIDGRSLGRITVTCGEDRVTSAPAMLIFLSVPLLLDGLSRFLQARGPRELRFAGVGSSFSIRFTREGEDRLRLAGGGRDLGTWPAREVVEALGCGARAFVETYLDRLGPGDLAYDDLETSLEEFEATFDLRPAEPGPLAHPMFDFLFVWDRLESAWPVRCVVGGAAPGGESVLEPEEAEAALERLRARYPEPRYVVARMSATSWAVVELDFPGLYSH